MKSFDREIREYEPINENQVRDKEVAIRSLDEMEDVLSRENPWIHGTSCAFVLNEDRTKILMLYHNVYDAWSMSGGHMDGDIYPLEVALKELEEETGLVELVKVYDQPVSLDLIAVQGHWKKGDYVNAHIHLNFTYLVIGKESASIRPKLDENSGVDWIPVVDLEIKCTEPHMLVIYRSILERVGIMRNIEGGN